jgi:hypothetical protein
VKVRVVEKAGGRPVPREATFALGGDIVAVAPAREERELALAGGLTYDVRVRPASGEPGKARKVAVSDEDGRTITVALD